MDTFHLSRARNFTFEFCKTYLQWLCFLSRPLRTVSYREFLFYLSANHRPRDKIDTPSRLRGVTFTSYGKRKPYAKLKRRDLSVHEIVRAWLRTTVRILFSFEEHARTYASFRVFLLRRSKRDRSEGLATHVSAKRNKGFRKFVPIPVLSFPVARKVKRPTQK